MTVRTQPTKPRLWERIKRRWRATSHGSEPGRWSVRKATLSKLEYERHDGGWEKAAK